MIVFSVETNFENLGTVQVEYTGAQKGNAAGIERLLGRTPSAEELMQLSPTSNERTFAYTVDGEQSRMEVLFETGERNLWVYSGGVITQYEPSIEHGWVRYDKETPRIHPPVRLFDVGFPQGGFPDCIRDWNVVSVATELNDGSTLTSLKTVSRSGREFTTTVFSSRFGFLPVRREFRDKTGNFTSVMEFKYLKVMQRDAWVLEEFSQTLFPPNVQDLETTLWSQKLRLDQTRLKVLEKLPE